MIYRELYVTALEDRLMRGGAQDDVVKAVAEFNAPTADGFARWHEAQDAYLCSWCGSRFKKQEVTLDQEVLCARHDTTVT